jgi:hypothetical protein
VVDPGPVRVVVGGHVADLADPGVVDHDVDTATSIPPNSAWTAAMARSTDPVSVTSQVPSKISSAALRPGRPNHAFHVR